MSGLWPTVHSPQSIVSSMIFIVGATCTGKTQLGIELAKIIPSEIISADSRQIYKYLNIGTAKPKGTWQKINGVNKFIVDGIPHHLIDFLSPEEYFSAGDFVRLTDRIVNEIKSNNKIPIIVGGTGLYISSYLHRLAFLPKRNENLRNELLELEKKQKKSLYNKLQKIDPVAAQKIHPNNLQRIVRALEVYYLTGKPISYWWQQNKQQVTGNKEQVLLIGLYQPRKILYERINDRVEKMLNAGMIEETEKLLKDGYKPNCYAMQSIGYKHVVAYIKNQIGFEKMKQLIKQDTRNYAKRQITWFKREKDIIWFDTSRVELSDILKHTQELWKKLSLSG